MQRIILILLTFSSLYVFGEVRAQNTTGSWPNSMPPGGVRGTSHYGENYRQGYRDGYRDGYQENRHPGRDSHRDYGDHRDRGGYRNPNSAYPPSDRGYRNPDSAYPPPYTPGDRVNYYGVPRY
jgi:hypothetical protein